MTRRLKLLGLAAVAIAAMTAVSAASASAANFHSESSPSFLFGEQEGENVFTVNGGNVKCKKATFTSGEIVGTSVASVEVTPAYSECTAFGQSATVAVNGCKYKLTASSATEGAVQVVCPVGASIVVTAKTAGCTVTVAAQTPGTPKVEYANQGSGSTRNVKVTSKVEKITYTSSGGICGASGENGKYSGTVVEKGFTNEAHTTQQGIFVE